MAIMFATLLVVIIGFMGLALDLSRVYNRKVELQAIADAAAIAAAGELVGTTTGVTKAASSASAAVADLKVKYNGESITWSDAALSFSDSPTSGNWVGASAATGVPDGFLYARVDTAALDPDISEVKAYFLQIFAPTSVQMNPGAVAVAGRSAIQVTPLAICAMSPIPARARAPSGELVEYGFRRGIGYDLMQLNSNGGAPENFVIDPANSATAAAALANRAPAVVGPFVCTGSMPMPRVMGNQITVSSPFPLASLFRQLNSRFDQYSGNVCSHTGAPPDNNIKSYDFNTVSWMKVAPTRQTALSTTSAGKLLTVADLEPSAPATTAAEYGTLWSFAKPVPFTAYAAGVPEPSTGYTPFNKSAWPALYLPAVLDTKPSYSAVPYLAGGGTSNVQQPSSAHGKGVKNRRVLNVPLIACPVVGGRANVLAIGRFFMTVPATDTVLNTEFAGIAPEQSLGGTVELFQ